MLNAKINLYFALIFCVFISFSTTEQISYSSTAFKESIKQISNPDRGFYKVVYITIGTSSFVHKPNPITESDKPDQVYHFRCDISKFSGAVNSDKKDKELTDTALDLLDTFLSYIKADNKNAVIRFSYNANGDKDSKGNYLNNEPSMDMIQTHIKQLSVVLNKYSDTITAIEAGMLGPWGEMHGTEMATDSNKAKVFKWWLENTNEKKIPILARSPKAMFAYFGKTLDEMENYEIPSTDKGYYLGLFNDCYLSSDTDVGTYSKRERETKWLSTINKHLPYGGETCAAYELSDLEQCLPEMKLLKLSYLNSGYSHAVTDDKWKKVKYDKTLGTDSLYYGMSGYDYIERHLGYRLIIKNVDVDYEKYGSYKMKIQLRNVGFGNLYRTKKVDIIYADMNNKEIYRKTVGNYKGELNMEFKDKFLSSDGSSEYKVYLSIYGSIEDKKVYYPVRFANENIYDSNFKGHLLFYVKKGVVTEP